MGSSQTRAPTHVPCIGRQILNHCATTEALAGGFLTTAPPGKSFFNYHVPLEEAGMESLGLDDSVLLQLAPPCHRLSPHPAPGRCHAYLWQVQSGVAAASPGLALLCHTAPATPLTPASPGAAPPLASPGIKFAKQVSLLGRVQWPQRRWFILHSALLSREGMNLPVSAPSPVCCHSSSYRPPSWP